MLAAEGGQASRAVSPAVPAPKPLLRTLLAVPVEVSIALVVHLCAPNNELPPDARLYSLFLGGIFGVAVAMAAIQAYWPGLRRWMREMCPIFAAAVVMLCVWELITAVLHLLPLPYFPGPAAVLQSLVTDRGALFDSTWHSLLLLLSGYTLGVAVALVTGICIGWSSRARYWGMPLLKVYGPVPAAAWGSLGVVRVSSST